MRATRRFPNSPSSVTRARRYVQEHLDGAPRDVADAVAIMTSELATNSIRHAATDSRWASSARGERFAWR